MIVTCPACETRYVVDDAALGGAEGRRVRCASCGNVWHCSPEAAAIHESIAEATAAAEAAAVATATTVPTAAPSQVQPLRAEPRAQSQPHSAGPSAPPRHSAEVALPAAARRRRARTGALSLTLLAVAIVLAAILARDTIMRMWPATVPVYTVLRLTETPGAGLEVSVTPTRTADSLVINGDIVNTAAAPRRVPRLRVALRDGNKVELDSKVIDPPVEVLAPGATTRFNTVFANPSITATGVAVTFAQ